MKNIEISIRAVQHYLYCPHRWGLIEIEKAWAENYFVTKANFIHERVHDSERFYAARGKITYTSIPVYNDAEQYNLYGITDCIELAAHGKKPKENDVISLHGEKLCIVEYKPTKPKDRDYRFDDLMQVFAQKICVDYVFSCDCDAEIYYADVKRRYKLPLKENFLEYDAFLKNCLKEMRAYQKDGKVPTIAKNQKCSGCSMKELCMPKIKKTSNVRQELRKINDDADIFTAERSCDSCGDF